MLEQLLKFISKKEVYGIIFVVCAGYILYKFSGIIFEIIINSGKTEHDKKKRKTIVRLFQNIVKYLMFIIILLIILELYGINTRSLIAGLGVLGAVLGLALQDTLKDLINGITIILDNFYVVGDTVIYDDFMGEVIELGLKTTKIKAVSGQVKIISNRNITQVINLSQKPACFTIDIPTAYEEESQRVEKLLVQLAQELKKQKDISNAEYLGINKFDDSSINYALRVWCKKGTQWDMERFVLGEIKKVYDKNNIKIPYPQIEVHNGKKV